MNEILSICFCQILDTFMKLCLTRDYKYKIENQKKKGVHKLSQTMLIVKNGAKYIVNQEIKCSMAFESNSSNLGYFFSFK